VTSFDNLGDYVAMPRLTGLRLVLAFLAQHVLGEPWRRPSLL
jgi:hypothetical protein